MEPTGKGDSTTGTAVSLPPLPVLAEAPQYVLRVNFIKGAANVAEKILKPGENVILHAEGEEEDFVLIEAMPNGTHRLRVPPSMEGRLACLPPDVICVGEGSDNAPEGKKFSFQVLLAQRSPVTFEEIRRETKPDPSGVWFVTLGKKTTGKARLGDITIFFRCEEQNDEDKPTNN